MSACALAAAAVSPPASAADADALDEVVVTAQHRSENLQNVPIAVTAFQSADLEKLRIADPSGLAAQTPSLVIKGTQGQSKPNVFLRGVGSNDFNATASSAVGFYTDEVFQGLPSGQLLQLFDLERVEVLRGPQGTLYGRNTTGGAVNFISRQPTAEATANASLTIAGFGEREAEIGATIPLEPGLAARLSAVYRKSDGDEHNQFTGRNVHAFDDYAVRGILRYELSADSIWTVSLHASRHDGDGPRYHFIPLNNGVYPNSVLPLIGVAPPYSDGSNWWAGSWDLPQTERVDGAGGSVKGVIDFGTFSLTTVSGYETVNASVLYDSDASPLNYVNVGYADKSWMASQELRLASTVDGPLSWIGGAYFYRDHINASNSFDIARFARDLFGALPNPSDPSAPADYAQQYAQPSRSLALFGSATYRFNERWHATLGARWTRDTKSIDYRTFQNEPATIGIVPLIGVAHRNAWSDVTGSATLERILSSSALLYGSVNRGFKSGEYNGSPIFNAATVSAVNPEYVTAWEIGAKTSWLAGTLVANIAGFYNDYKDMQVFRFVADPQTGIPTAFLENAAAAKIKGVELELHARPVTQLDIEIGAAYIDATFHKYLAQQADPTNTLPKLDYSGNQLVGAPREHFNAVLEYALHLPADLRLVPRYEITYNSRTYYDVSNNPLLSQSGYAVMNASVRLENSQRRWDVTAWVKNLDNKRYATDALDLSSFGFDISVHGDRRVFGGTLSYRFD